MPPREPSLFVNLPVRDVARSRAFYEGLGWAIDERYGDDAAACVVISPQIRVMLQVGPVWAGSSGSVDDAGAVTPLLTLAVDSRFHVDHLAERAVASGGVEAREPADHGSAYSRFLRDPDGHVWEITWMDDDAA